MEVDFAFLCDYADNPGKLNAIGIGFDTLFASSLPHTHPLFFAVIRLRFSSVEIGDRTFGLRIIDADGNSVTPPIDGAFRVEPPPPGLTDRTVTIAHGFMGSQFPQYGGYAVVWLVGGNEAKRTPFRVASPPASA